MTFKTFSMPAGGEKMVPVICPVCASGAHRPHLRCRGFGFVRCRVCGHVFQNPQPVFDDLQRRYQDEYFAYERHNEEAFFRLMLLGLADIGFGAIEATLPPGRAFLDIGCATGMLLAHMQSRGWSVQGVEISRPAAEFGMRERRIPIFIGPVEKAPLAPASFSFIHFSHVIEHIPDPRGFLEKVRSLLADEGHLVVVTPNIEGFQARLLGPRWRSAIADHLHLFRRENLDRLLRETGFRPVRWQTWGGIAQGLAPRIVKQPVDRLAKRFGFGDVMLCHARARNGNGP
jgi:SAM-dependent methyltransferase